MREVEHTTLNAPHILGEYLARIGIEQVEIIPTVYIDNNTPTVTLHISYKMFSRLHKEIENLLIKPSEEEK
jgi:hypothetical protein